MICLLQSQFQEEWEDLLLQQQWSAEGGPGEWQRTQRLGARYFFAISICFNSSVQQIIDFKQ